LCGGDSRQLVYSTIFTFKLKLKLKLKH